MKLFMNGEEKFIYIFPSKAVSLWAWCLVFVQWHLGNTQPPDEGRGNAFENMKHRKDIKHKWQYEHYESMKYKHEMRRERREKFSERMIFSLMHCASSCVVYVYGGFSSLYRDKQPKN